MEQYIDEPAAESNSNRRRRSSAPIDESEDNPSTGLECYICFETVKDPVVTFCGHLYCWPCIYQWIQPQSVPSEISEHQQPQCPVCKAKISRETLIPLYGRGLNSPRSPDGNTLEHGMVIPKRPPRPRFGGYVQAIAEPIASTRALSQLHSQTHANQHRFDQYPISGSNMASRTISLNGPSIARFTSPMMAWYDIVLAWMCGVSEIALRSHEHNAHSTSIYNSRIRRHLMMTERSLDRVSFFLLCCVMVCLLLF